MTHQKITTSYKLNQSDQFIESITEPANTVYYAFAAKHTQYANTDSEIEDPQDTEEYMSSVYRDMIFGKRVTENDVFVVIPRHDWEANTVFTQYDDDDPELFSKSFYAIVNADAQYHVYKCLYNNNGAPSTIEPDFSAVSANDDFYETSDGYIWKYMYSVNSSIVSKFSTETYFPASSNADVVSAARDGAIDLIEVVGSGNGYNNYVSGVNQFSPADLRLNGNNLLYNISANASAASSNDYYNGCYIYIKSGPAGEVGQYKKIVDYVVNSTSKTIVLETPFANAISISSTYDIYPSVTITGDGTQTINATARAIVNAAGNTIQKVDILNRGAGYKDALAEVYAYPDVGVTNAHLKVVKSPYRGHGSKPELELGASAMVISIDFSNTEGNTILSTNDYRTFGILRDPMFHQVGIETQSVNGIFLAGEDVFKIRPALLGTDAVVSSDSANVDSDSGDFENQFSEGDYIYLSSGNSHMVASVDEVTNSSHLVLTTNVSFSSNAASFHLPRLDANGIAVSSNSSYVTLANVAGIISTGDKLVGAQSGAYAVANTMYRGGAAKGFSTFINTFKYVGSMVSGEFVEDEVVTQGSANAVLHSATSNTFYVTNQWGSFTIGQTITGLTSGAVATITAKYDPEVVFRSGEIVFMENMLPISRDPSQAETFKVVFAF